MSGIDVFFSVMILCVYGVEVSVSDIGAVGAGTGPVVFFSVLVVVSLRI